MADTYEVQVLGTIAGQACASVLHFTGADTAVANPVPVMEALLTAFGDSTVAGEYSNAYLVMLPTNYIMRGLRCRRVGGGGSPTVSVPIASTIGVRSGVADVSGVGPVGLWHCQDAGSNWRTGKIFVPGVSTGDVAANVFSPSLLADIALFMDLWTTPIGAGPEGPFTQVVWSPTDSVPLAIISDSVSLKVGTQRRRYVPL